MDVGFVFSTVFFIAWPSQPQSGRRRPGEFVEDGSPVVDPSGRVRAVLPALADGQEEDLHSRVDVRERPAAPDRGVGPRRGTRHTSTMNPSCVNLSETDLRMR